jgi:ABC-type glycerol-3-phosphate transport system substrate-binding protein
MLPQKYWLKLLIFKTKLMPQEGVEAIVHYSIIPVPLNATSYGGGNKGFPWRWARGGLINTKRGFQEPMAGFTKSWSLPFGY